VPANELEERFSELVERELGEIKKDAIYLCRAALDFLEMGESALARYLAEQAEELLEAYYRAKSAAEEPEVEALRLVLRAAKGAIEA